MSMTQKRSRVAPGTIRHAAHGLCHRDFDRIRKYGNADDPQVVVSMAAQRDALERMRDPSALEEGDCWEWPDPAPRTEDEYGVLAPSLAICPSPLAHRNAYIIAFGPIPDGLFVCHHCDNPPCFRASHLFAGTNADNMRDMVEKGRSASLPGTSHPKSKFTEDAVRAIVEHADSGLTSDQIAPLFGVASSTIRSLLRGASAYRSEVGV